MKFKVSFEILVAPVQREYLCKVIERYKRMHDGKRFNDTIPPSLRLGNLHVRSVTATPGANRSAIVVDTVIEHVGTSVPDEAELVYSIKCGYENEWAELFSEVDALRGTYIGGLTVRRIEEVRESTVGGMADSGSPNYIIRGGEAGRERLRVVGRVLWPTTEALFRRVGIPPTASCLDVGCGGGDVSVKLRQLAPEGRVVGVDLDPVKVELARSDAAAAGFPDIEFRVEDVTAPPRPPMSAVAGWLG